MFLQVNTAAVEQYTGEGDPPYCEMTLKGAMPDGSTPPDLTLPINITGVKESTTITLKRDAQKSLEHILGNSEYVTGKHYAQTTETNINGQLMPCKYSLSTKVMHTVALCMF